MTKTETMQHAHVRPSSRDPITTWLEVFTKLLAVPPVERIRIRDELEDHLRMRVDDLLILGISEPEAVQKAVTELGETAELAKRFKEARTSTRRRNIMHTALFAVAGLALTMSVANVIPGASKQNTSDNQAETALVQPSQGESEKNIFDFDIAADSLDAVLGQIAQAAGARGFVHWGSLDFVGVTQDTEVGQIPSMGLELDKVQELLNSMLGLEDGAEMTSRMDNGLIEFGTVSYFDKRELITMDHDVSDLVQANHVLEHTREAANLGDSIMTIIEPSIWSGGTPIGAIALNGSQLSVRAPERIQVQIIEYVERLRHAQRQQLAQQMHNQEEQEEGHKLQIQELIDRLEISKRDLARQLAEFEAELPELNRIYWSSEYEIKDVEAAYHMNEDPESREQQRAVLVDLRTQLDSVSDRRELIREDLNRLRVRISQLDNDQVAYSLQGDN